MSFYLEFCVFKEYSQVALSSQQHFSTTDSVLSLEIFLKSSSLSVKIYSAVYYRFVKPPGCAFTCNYFSLIPCFSSKCTNFPSFLDTTMPIPLISGVSMIMPFTEVSCFIFSFLTNLIWMRIKDFKGHKQKNYKLRQNTFSLYYTQLVHLFSI